MPSQTLFIFLDESGNFDFSQSGTRHLVMSAISTTDPSQNLRVLGSLKYELLSSGINIPNFHASEDVQQVRNLVFSNLVNLSITGAKTFWIRKDDPRCGQGNPLQVYRRFGSAFASWAIRQKKLTQAETVVLVFDRALSSRERSTFRSATKGLFASFDGGYYVFFHNVHKDFNGQIADYLAWAHYVDLERNEKRPLNALPPHFADSQNLFDWLEGAQQIGVASPTANGLNSKQPKTAGFGAAKNPEYSRILHVLTKVRK